MGKIYIRFIDWAGRNPERLIHFAVASVLSAILSAAVDVIFGAFVPFFACFALELAVSRIRYGLTGDHTFNLLNVLAAICGIAAVVVPLAFLV